MEDESSIEDMSHSKVSEERERFFWKIIPPTKKFEFLKIREN